MNTEERIVSWLFSVPGGARRWYEIIFWWEFRRIPYNLIVGFVGVFCLAVVFALGDSLGLEYEAWKAAFCALATGIAANVCYTGGWVGETIVRRIWKEGGQEFGPIALRLGLIFSVAVPILLSVWFIVRGMYLGANS
jgi:hypothetical protein